MGFDEGLSVWVVIWLVIFVVWLGWSFVIWNWLALTWYVWRIVIVSSIGSATIIGFMVD